MSEKKILRASSLPLGARCRAAVATIAEVELEDEIPREISGEPAELGKSYHWIAQQVQLEPKRASDFGALLREAVGKYKVPIEDLAKLLRLQRPLASMGQPSWVVVEHRVEQELACGWLLRGHLDLAQYWQAHAFLEIHDWKTGWLAATEEDDAPYNDQLKAYAAVFAVTLRSGGYPVDRVRGQLDKVRDADPEPDAFEWVGDQISDEWVKLCALADEIAKQAELPPAERSYRVGPWCRHNHCRRRCKAYKAEMTTALATFDEIEVTTTNAGPLYEKLQLLKKLVKGLDDAIRETVQLMGSLDYDEANKVLELRPQLRKPALGPALVEKGLWDALNANIGNVPPAERQAFVDGVMKILDEREKVEVFRLGLYKQPKQLKAKN